MPDPAYSALESRSTTVLVLGILSLVVCGLLGPFAWSMGEKVRKDARAIGRDEPGNNKGGRICGMIGTILLGLAIVVTIGLIVAALVFGSRGSTSISRSDGFAPAAIQEMQPTTVDAVNQPAASVDASVFFYGEGACAPADGSAPKTTSFMQEPKLCIDPSKTYTAIIETTKGSYTILLDPDHAPGTVNNFVNLSRFHYFDDTPCHRIIKDFMAQCGDPSGNGRGGPGYTISDELPVNIDDYQPGTVAMANSGPNTNGSQFFTMFRSGLQPSYTIFGHVVEGMGTTVKALNAVGNPTEGAPTEPVRIIRVTITES